MAAAPSVLSHGCEEPQDQAGEEQHQVPIPIPQPVSPAFLGPGGPHGLGDIWWPVGRRVVLGYGESPQKGGSWDTELDLPWILEVRASLWAMQMLWALQCTNTKGGDNFTTCTLCANNTPDIRGCGKEPQGAPNLNIAWVINNYKNMQEAVLEWERQFDGAGRRGVSS